MEKKNLNPLRLLWIVAGCLSLTVGAVGVVLPLLPGTPFFILAAFCFSRGSERMHQWLLRQPVVGVAISDWRAHGSIRLRTKCMATALILPSIFYLAVLTDMPWGGKVALLGVICLVFLFIWTRPSALGPR